MEDNLLVVLDVSRILDEETIMKTPRRTRRRRVLKAASGGKKNAAADEDGPAAAEAKALEDKQDESVPRGDAKSGVTAARNSAPANDTDTMKAAVKPARAPNSASAPNLASAPKPADTGPKQGGDDLIDRLGGEAKVEIKVKVKLKVKVKAKARYRSPRPGGRGLGGCRRPGCAGACAWASMSAAPIPMPF